jgi:hypothetical protein
MTQNNQIEKCGDCGGSGRGKKYFITDMKITCPTCHGSGWVDSEPKPRFKTLLTNRTSKLDNNPAELKLGLIDKDEQLNCSLNSKFHFAQVRDVIKETSIHQLDADQLVLDKAIARIKLLEATIKKQEDRFWAENDNANKIINSRDAEISKQSLLYSSLYRSLEVKEAQIAQLKADKTKWEAKA